MFRPISTDPAQPAIGELAWANQLPLNQSWLAYVQATVPTNLAVTNGRSALGYLQLFQSNQLGGSGTFSNSSRIGWGRGYSTNSSSNTLISDFKLQNAPYATTNFSSNEAVYFTNASGSSRALLAFSNLGTANHPTNRLVYRATTNGTLFAGAPGPAAALAMPSFILPSASSWQVTATVNIDPSKFNEWTDETQGFAIGLNLVKHVTNQTPLQLMANRVALEFGWQGNGGSVVCGAFAGGSNLPALGLTYPLFGGGNLEGINTLRLSFVYDAAEKTLSSFYEDPVDGWLPADDGLDLASLTGSLGRFWSFDAEKGFFRLILSANSNYELFDDETSTGAGNAVAGHEVPVFFSDLEVVVQPENATPMELAGDSLWLILKYDATTRELIQGFADDSSDWTTFLPETVLSLNSWTANDPLQLRLGVSSAQSTNPANGIRFQNFSVIPGEGQLVYSLVESPEGFEIDSDLGKVTATNLPNAGLARFTVLASNLVSGLTATQTFRLDIGPARPRLAVTSSNLPLRYGFNTTSALVVTAVNTNELGTNPIILSAPNLPAGLSFTTASNSLTIRGTPTAVTAATNLVISASNVAGTAILTSSISILPAVPRLQLVQNRPSPQYSAGAVTSWSNAYWTVKVSNTAGQNTGAFPNVIIVSNLPPSLLFRTEGTAVAGPGGTATNTGIISLATNRITNADIYSNVVFTASNISGVSTLTSTITVLPTVPVLALVTNAGGATNSGTASNPVFLNLAFGSSNTNWFRIANTLDVPVTYSMQDAPRGMVINPSNGVVSGRIEQAINATNVVFRGTNSAGASTVLRARINTLPPVPIFSVVANQASNGVATDVLVLTVSNFSNMGTNLIQWSTSATNATNSQGNLGRFSQATNANRSVFTIRTTTNSINAGIYSNISVTASNSGGSTIFTTNLVVLPEIPSLAAISNLVTPPRFGEPSTNALQVSLARTNRQNLVDFPVTFLPVTNLPSSWTLNTNSSNAWISSELAEEAANTTLRFRASNAAGMTLMDLNLRVLPLAPEIAVTTNTNRLQYGSATSANFLKLEVDSFGQNMGQFPVTWRISNAPPGVALTFSNNVLTNYLGGTNPTRAGVFPNVQIIASNAGGATTNFCDLTVFPQIPQIRLVTNRVQYNSNSSNALLISVTNANPSNSLGLGSDGFGIIFTASNPPASLTLSTNNATNATLGGTPNRATNATFTLTVSNLAGAVSTNVNLKILPAPPQLSVITNRAQYGVSSPGALIVTITNTNDNAQDFSNFPASFTVSPTLPGLAFTSSNGVGSYGGSSPQVVTNNAALTVTVTNEGGVTSTNLRLSVLPALPLFKVTNNRTQYGINGSNALVVTVTNTAGQNTNSGQFPIFTFSSTNLPLGQIAFTNTNGLTATAGSANPNLATNAIITVVVSNAAGATTNSNVSLKILPALPQFTLATNRAQIGVDSPGALVATVTNTNGQNTNSFPLSFSVTPALAGLGFTNTNGYVGTYGGSNPAVVTNTLLTVVASNEAGATTNSTNFSVLPGLVTFTNLASLPEGILNTAYGNSASGFQLRFDPAVQNDTNYSISYANLPPGLIAQKDPTSSGVARIRGTPSSPGIFSNAQVIFSNAGGSSTNTFTMRIRPAAPQISVINNGATFGVNTTNALVVTVTNTAGQNTSNFPISFSVSPTLAGLAFISTNGLVGTYGGTNPAVVTNAILTVTVTNYGGTNQTNISFQVGKASSTIAVTGTNNFTYSGSALGPTTYTNTGSTGAVTFSYAGTNSTVYAASSSRPTNAGNYTARATVVADSNYNGTNSAAFAFTISKGGSTIAVTGTNNFTYSGSALGPTTYTNTGSTGAVTFSYAGTNSTVYAASSSRPTNAGNYTARATVVADSNYNGTNSAAFAFTINKAEQTITFGVIRGRVFGVGGSEFILSGSSSSGLEVSFSSMNESVATVSGRNVRIVGAGTAPVVASQAGNSNYAAAVNVTNNLVVEGGIPEVVGPNSNNISFRTNQVFSYQISARSAGQFWAGRSDFPDNGALTNSWLTNGMANSEASLNSTNNGYLQYRWSTNAATFAYLEWSQPLPADSGWLASVTVNFATNNGTNYVVADLTGLGLTEGEYLYGMLSAFRDATDTNNVVDAVFGGNSNQPTGFTSALAITNGTNVIEGIGTNPSSASYGWIGLQTTTNGGTNRLLVLGNPYSNSPVWWSTNLALPISTWTNAARSNTLVLRLSGNSLAPTNEAYALEFSQFTVVPLGQLGYDWDALPAGLNLDRETGLITGIPTSTNNTISTITITNSHGTTNIILNFTHDNE